MDQNLYVGMDTVAYRAGISGSFQYETLFFRKLQGIRKMKC